MTAGLIGAYAAAAVAIIGAVFAGLAQLQHVRDHHGQPPAGPPQDGGSTTVPPGPRQ